MAGQLGSKKTTIGKLRQRLTIQVPATALNEFREREPGWTDVATPVRAEIVPTGGREFFQNGMVQSQATHRVRMRYRGDLTTKNRLVWLDTGRILNIVACPPSVGTSNLIEVLCKVEGG